MVKQYTKEEQKSMDIATTIIRQMGGGGKLRAMVGAYDILALDSGVQFSFKNSKTMNKCVIKLTPMDLYDVEFYHIPKLGKITTKSLASFMDKIEKCKVPIHVSEGVYNEMLVDIFESVTGLDIHLGD